MARKPATASPAKAGKPAKAKAAPKSAPKAAPKAAQSAHPNAIDVTGHPLGDDFLEIMRLWVEPAGAMNAFIRPRLKDPELFGRMLAQAARQGARAYARDKDMDEGEALQRIWAGIDGARAPQPNDQGKTEE